jgi:hypothetical protein
MKPSRSGFFRALLEVLLQNSPATVRGKVL